MSNDVLRRNRINLRFLIGFMLMGCIAATNVFAVEKEKPVKIVTPQDFAYAVPLQFDGQDAVYQATLPLSVYKNTVRSDLGDLRVFNAQGEIVPHMLLQPERSSISKPARQKLVYFPLEGQDNADLDQLSIRIKRNAAGTLIDIGSHAKQTSTSKLSGYLLDTSAIKQSIQALELDWDASKKNFVGTLNIESSDDLQQWRSVLRDAPLASLQYDGHTLLQKRVEFSATQSKYLRLSWPQDQAALHLSSISAELGAVSVDTPLSWLPVKGTAIADKAGEYQFDLGAHLPIQRMRIELPQLNTLVQAAIFSRARAEDVWRPVSHTVLYKLHHSGQDLNSPDIAVASNHRYWMLRIDQKSGGLGAGVPEMQIGWQAHQLQFVTRGSPPFQLAYGSMEIMPAEFRLQNVMSPATQDKPALKIQSAKTGEQIVLGGESLLSPPPLPLPWKKWILWAVLGLAVLILGWMAYRLVKQMESYDSSK